MKNRSVDKVARFMCLVILLIVGWPVIVPVVAVLATVIGSIVLFGLACLGMFRLFAPKKEKKATPNPIP